MSARNILIVVMLLGAAVFIYRSFAPPEAVPTGEALANVLVPDLSPAAREGQAVFDRSCASCHGRNAAGQDGIAPPLVHKIYEPNHHGDMSFHLAAANGVRAHHWPFGDMPPVDGVTKPELDKIVLYVRELQRANGIF